MNKRNFIRHLVLMLSAILLVNIASNLFYKRIDITADNRYSISKQTKEIVGKINQPILVEVYLKGSFPSEFKRLQLETIQVLEELQAYNSNIVYKLIDPLSISEELINRGLTPSRLTAQENGSISESIIFPWAVIHYNEEYELVSLLKTNFLGDSDEQLQQSIQNLEYAFAEGFQHLLVKKSKKIAVLRGNGELDDIYLADFLQQLGKQYHLAPFTLDSVAKNPSKTLSQLKNFDLAIIAKPTERFTEEEKFTLDQFIMKGGKTLWLVDQVHAELDSLLHSGTSAILPRDLNLTDMLFSYGIRLNYNVVQDLYSAKITLATGNVGNKPQYNQFLWNYFPLIISKDSHLITKNIEPILLKFPSSIDTLSNNVKKTVLLQSSNLSKTVGTPALISLESILEKPNPDQFNGKGHILGVLLEGKFKSAYINRVPPYKTLNYLGESNESKMILISDGDIVANQLHLGEPLPLGQDKWTNTLYGNKTFLYNAVNYLLDDNGLLSIRNKTIDIKLLDKEKAYSESTFWKILNIFIPLFLLLLLGLFIYLYRNKKFKK
ncbi:MAG: gliding motility-associated ABC transporter substrate-binding protein GldG [Bacteroidetes bacterium]|nr:gliding motility-associated ABC transporter substrate-binding protein GldG [Bacteroidota bacterium]